MTRHSVVTKAMWLITFVMLLVLALMWVNPDLTLRNTRWQSPGAQPLDFQAMLKVITNDAPASASFQMDSNALLVMQERPLFVVGRRPVPPAAPVQALDDEKVEVEHVWHQAYLLGIIEGKVNGIIFRARDKDRRLLQGQSYEGWMLTRVEPASAEFTHAGKKHILPLQKKDFSSMNQSPQNATQQPASRKQTLVRKGAAR